MNKEKVRMTIRLSETLEHYLKEKSKETGLSKNAIIIQACWQYVEEKQKKETAM